MKYLLKNTLRPVYHYVKNAKEREFNQLLNTYGNAPRYQEKKQVKFLDYSFDVPDLPSFVWQFKELFVDEIYQFNTDNDCPVIFDCGANIGMSCLYFKVMYPKARITAFEADKNVAQYLTNNMQNNHIADIDIINKAVWTTDAGIFFHTEGADGGSIVTDSMITVATQKIESIRLKDYLQKEKVIDLLKIDIEGAEVAVIEDCQDALSHIKHIFIEYHAWQNQPQALSKILAILERSGFRYYLENINPRKLPFIDQGKTLKMDLQMNIWAVRESM